MSLAAVLLRKSTKEIIIEGIYPRAEITPFLEGEIDPDYEWLIKYMPYEEPLYDSRMYIMQDVKPVGDELLNCPPHPLYPGLKAYTHTFNPIKRSNEEIIREIENAEKDANDAVWRESEYKDGNMFMMNSVYKDAKGFELTQEEQEQINKLNLVTVKLAKNKDTKEIKIAQLTANQNLNIDEGWERSL